jgi:REP element-mobilizing transposase RayT
MVNYRRNDIKGGTYFFTVNVYHRKTGLLTRYIEELRHAFRVTKQQHPFQIDAIVILPDHLHTLWTLPEGDDHYPQRWRSIKSQFTRAIKAKGYPLKKTNAVNITSGKNDIGNTPLKTIVIYNIFLITSITTPLNMDM